MDNVLQAEEALFEAARELGTLNVLALLLATMAVGVVILILVLVWKLTAPLVRQNSEAFRAQATSNERLASALDSSAEAQRKVGDTLGVMTLTMNRNASTIIAHVTDVEDVVEAGVTTVASKVTQERETGVKEVIKAANTRFDALERVVSQITRDMARINAALERVADAALVHELKQTTSRMDDRLQFLVNLMAQEKKTDETLHVAVRIDGVPDAGAGTGTGDSDTGGYGTD